MNLIMALSMYLLVFKAKIEFKFGCKCVFMYV